MQINFRTPVRVRCITGGDALSNHYPVVGSLYHITAVDDEGYVALAEESGDDRTCGWAMTHFEQVAAADPDSDIDLSDIPEKGPEWFRRAALRMEKGK